MCDHCGCRSFPPIAELSAEHDDILRCAWEVAEATRDGSTPPAAAVDELVHLLEVHVRKEETGLYPELIAGGSLSAEQLGELEQEHRDLDEALRTLRFDRRAYFALAAHIEVEEMELFPAAMFDFDDEEWDAVEDAHLAAAGT